MTISHPEYLYHLEIDETSGLPKTVSWQGKNCFQVEVLDFDFTLSIGGDEMRSPTGGIDYRGAQTLNGVSLEGSLDDLHWVSSSEGDMCSLPVKLGPVSACLEYLFRRHGPGLTLRLVINGDSHSSLLIRNLTLSTEVRLPGRDWTLNAPGNGLARDIPLGQVTAWSGISPVGGLRGSSAVLHLSSPEHNLALWLRQELEVADMRIKGSAVNVLSLELSSNFAADLGRAGQARLELFDLDLSVPKFAVFAETFQTWLRMGGHTTPTNPPPWIGAASIYEAQVGFSVFYPDHCYAPYPEVSDLTADLDRIAALGFNVIQLMPRQPYPSYNVHDYWNIATSFGDPGQLRTLVAECHRREIRIILDVLMHGVIDQESITAAAEGVRSGPYADRIKDHTSDSFASEIGEWDDYLTAWSRHIIDFEPFWKAGSPAISPLVAEHPDWFFRDSSGKIAGIYTKAFDARNPQWRAYFTEAMKFLLGELGVDGFRFDAPTYNDFHNWSAWARHRAGMSALACVPLFERLRAELKILRPDMLMYTEPSGILLRRSMDLNYNYDEQWLVTAVSQPGEARVWGVRSARGLARWVQDRDAFLPRGAMTAHHIDSHDTFWWPSWGSKWRREQFPLAHVRLLSLIFMSLPGPFMMFTGGEEGIEEVLQSFNALKRRTVDWAALEVSWLTQETVPENIFGILRHNPRLEILTLVNLSDRAETVRVGLGLVQAPARVVLSVGNTSDWAIADSQLNIEMPPRSGVVLQRGPVSEEVG